MLVEIVVHPFFWQTFDKNLIAEFLRFFLRLLWPCLHDSKVLLVEAQDSAFAPADRWELELIKCFLSVIKFLELDESKVEIFEHWSIMC